MSRPSSGLIETSLRRRLPGGIYHACVTVSLIVERVTRIKSEITISVGVSVKIVKNTIPVKKIIFGILFYLVAKIVNN